MSGKELNSNPKLIHKCHPHQPDRPTHGVLKRVLKAHFQIDKTTKKK